MPLFGKSGKRKAAEAAAKKAAEIQAQQQAAINKQMAERARYIIQAQNALQNAPQYNIPGAVNSYTNLMNRLGGQLGSQMTDYADKIGDIDYLTQGRQDLASGYDTAINTLQKGGQSYLSGLRGAESTLGTNLADMIGSLQAEYQDARNIYGQGAASLRDIMQRGVSQSEDYARQGMTQGLSDTQSFVDYYRQMAQRQEMPGQRLLEDKLGRSYAEGYKAIQQAGQGASGLGAMIDLASRKADSMADIGIQSAQFQLQQQQQLAGAQERAAAIRQSIYNQMAEGSLSRAGALAGAETTATQMTGGAAENMANALAQGRQYAAGQQYQAGVNTAQGGMDVASQLAGAQQSRGTALADFAMNQQNQAVNQAQVQANLINQGITGQANLQGAGLLTKAEYQDTAYQYNQLMPWQTGMNFYTNLIGSMNPYAAQQDLYNQQMNQMNNMFQLFGKKGRYGI